MKKIVIFGGGSGLSQILKGLKLFPLDITAVVSVSDNGGSTGRVRKDYNIPAVGDISKVLLAMSDCDEDLKNLMNYRFTKSKTLGNHSIKNLLLTALIDLKGKYRASQEMRGLAPHYFKGLKNAKKIRLALSKINNYEDFKRLLLNIEL